MSKVDMKHFGLTKFLANYIKYAKNILCAALILKRNIFPVQCFHPVPIIRSLTHQWRQNVFSA